MIAPELAPEPAPPDPAPEPAQEPALELAPESAPQLAPKPAPRPADLLQLKTPELHCWGKTNLQVDVLLWPSLLLTPVASVCVCARNAWSPRPKASSFLVSSFFTGSPVFPESACEGFFVENHLQNYVSSTSSHLHLCTSTFSPISLLIFTSSHIYMFTSSHLHIYIITAHLHFLIFTSGHLHLCSSSHPHVCTSHILTSHSSELSLLRPGTVPPEHRETQPSAEIVRVESAKRR